MKEKRADDRIRTGDLFITSESLCQLSHIGLCPDSSAAHLAIITAFISDCKRGFSSECEI